MVAELWGQLVGFTIAASLAVAIVLLLRPMAIRAFGVRVAYGLWALVPALAIAATAPKPAANDLFVLTTAPILRTTGQPIADSLHVVTNMTNRIQAILLVAWGIGFATSIAMALLRQRGYWRSLGKTTRIGSVVRAECASSPALVGILRPLLLLPRDFEELHTAHERAMILAHEEAHRRRADPLANAGGELIRCLQWFNPLLHFGHSIYRRDQEMACDAIAAGTEPGQRAQYAELLVRTQRTLHDVPVAPLGASWHSLHPLTARLLALRKRAPSLAVVRCGTFALGLTLSVLTYGAWAIRAEAAEPTGATPIALHINWYVDRAPKGSMSPADIQERTLVTDIVVPSGGNVELFLTSPSGQREYAVNCSPKVLMLSGSSKPNGQIRIDCEFKRADGSVFFRNPQVITTDSKDATIEAGDSDGAGGKLVYSLKINPSTDELRVKQAQAAQHQATKN